MKRAKRDNNHDILWSEYGIISYVTVSVLYKKVIPITILIYLCSLLHTTSHVQISMNCSLLISFIKL